jgi:CarD family transcriptional regulator
MPASASIWGSGMVGKASGEITAKPPAPPAKPKSPARDPKPPAGKAAAIQTATAKSATEPATGKKLTSALKPKPTVEPSVKPPLKPVAKAEVKPAKPPAKAAPLKETASVKTPPSAKPAVAGEPKSPVAVAAIAAVIPTPAPVPPAPQSHSGVISGPMRPMAPPRAMAKAEIFVDGDFVVYPTHGVGKVERIATEEIAGHKLELIHITFDENRMTLRVPTNKARTAGLRKLASRKQFDDVLATLKGRARIKRTMWSRRAQEYEAKINSGDLSAIAEVVRDLHRNAGQPDQSFSERQIYESALDRLAAEYAALEQTDKPTAIERLIAHLKSD